MANNIGGGANNITFEYKGFTQTKSTTNFTTVETYNGTETTLKKGMNTGDKPDEASGNNKWKPGYIHPDYGRLDNVTIKQTDGPFWQAVVTYNNSLIYGGGGGEGEEQRATSASLDVVMKSMPLETHPQYKYLWNHILIRKGEYEDGSIDIDDRATVAALDISSAMIIANRSSGYLRWIKNDSQIPTEITYRQDSPDSGSQPVPEVWTVAQYMTKPGVQYYEMPSYVIREYGRYNNLSTSYWFTTIRAGRRAEPTITNFGITSGEWLCLGGTSSFDGKYYQCDCSYEWSPDWDHEIYPNSAGIFD